MEGSSSPRPPLWATHQFRWLLFILIATAASITVLIVEIMPSLEPRKLDLPPGVPRPASIRTLADLTAAGKAPYGDFLLSVLDRTPANEADEGYLKLVRRLRDVKAEDLAKDAVHIDYALFPRDPGGLRGRVVRVIALIIDDVDAVPLVIDGGTVDWVYRTHLLDPSGDEGYVVDVLQKPEGLGRRDLVLVNAVFMKLGTYEGLEGRIITAPVLVGRELVRMEEERAVNAWDDRMIYVAGALAVLVLLGTTLWAFLSVRARSLPGPRRVLLPRRPRREEKPSEHAVRPAQESEGAPVKPAARPPLLRRREELAPRARPSPLFRLLVPALLLACVAAYMLFLRPGRHAGGPVDPVRRAHEGVLEVESKVWARGEVLTSEDLKSIRTGLRTLIASSEEHEARLRALERQGKWASDESKAIATRLLEVKLWILDASDVADAGRAGSDPALAGIFIPHQLALRKLEAAEAEVKALESAPGGPKVEARGGLETLKATLEDCRRSFEGLVVRVKEGLARDDLTAAQLPFLGTLEAQAARAAEGVRRVDGILAKPSG